MALKKLIACSILGLLITFPVMAQTPEEIEQEIQDGIAAIDELKTGLSPDEYYTTVTTTATAVASTAISSGHSKVRVHAAYNLAYVTGDPSHVTASVLHTISMLTRFCERDDLCAAMAIKALALVYSRHYYTCELAATEAILKIVSLVPTADVKREASKALGIGIRSGGTTTARSSASATLSQVQAIKTISLTKVQDQTGEWKIIVDGEPVSFVKRNE